MAPYRFANFILTLVFFLLVGCDLPTPKDGRDGEDSTYAVESFEGEATSINIHETVAIPASNNYNFKACLANLRQKRPIVSHKFIIEENGKELFSDVKGCVTWSETIAYNFFAESRFLKFDRTLKAVGTHRGRRTIQMAINPWPGPDGKAKDV